jgi:hypothetical protein
LVTVVRADARADRRFARSAAPRSGVHPNRLVGGAAALAFAVALLGASMAALAFGLLSVLLLVVLCQAWMIIRLKRKPPGA